MGQRQSSQPDLTSVPREERKRAQWGAAQNPVNPSNDIASRDGAAAAQQA